MREKGGAVGFGRAALAEVLCQACHLAVTRSADPHFWDCKLCGRVNFAALTSSVGVVFPDKPVVWPNRGAPRCRQQGRAYPCSLAHGHKPPCVADAG